MSTAVRCPICLSAYGAICEQYSSHGGTADFGCTTCGRFQLSGSLYASDLDPERDNLSSVQRATLSHFLRRHVGEPSTLTTEQFGRLVSNVKLPTPAIQANNMIRFIGDQVNETGTQLETPPGFYAVVGCPNPILAGNLLIELIGRGWVEGIDARDSVDTSHFLDLNLKLAGWEQYEGLRRGQLSSRTAFLALRFGDPTLEEFVQSTIKPCIKDELSFDLVDMRDVARAGVIDNIMRQQIRDSAFVLVDLTHDNSGAYWEAGYAEGLGKPVVYLCEKTKFDAMKTHFDTNHCTTVIWSVDDRVRFRAELVATVRRSLEQF